MESSKVQLSGLRLSLLKPLWSWDFSRKDTVSCKWPPTCCFQPELIILPACPSIPLISALPKEDMLKTLIYIRLPKNGKAMERDPETLESPCKGAALAVGDGKDPVTWGLVLTIPSLNMLLPADTETRGIALPPPKAPLWPSSSLPRGCRAEIPVAISLEVTLMEKYGF